MLKTAAKQYKFVLVGDSAVGKSSLINRFVDKTFNQSLMSTIGVDFKFRKVRIDNNQIKLQIWDTAGQQTFRSIVSAYYSSADAIVIVYDITAYQSFQNVKQYWIKEADNNNKNNAKIFLIGNKVDQQSRRQVQKFSIETFIEENQISGLYEASAKTGLKVQQAFTQITKNLYFGIQNDKLKSKKENVQNINKGPVGKEELRKSQKTNQQKDQIQREEKAVSQIDEDLNERRQYQEKKVENKLRINQQGNRPKNPNYNKGCCK